MSGVAHLRVVDTSTGELRDDGCESCGELRVQLAARERDVRTWSRRCAELERDHEAEAESHELQEDAKRLFDYWRRACGHPKSKWTPDRFWEVERWLRRYGLEMCERAIAGAAFDHWTTTRRNGSTKRFDGWGLIFPPPGPSKAPGVEEFANRAPKDWKSTLDQDGEHPA